MRVFSLLFCWLFAGLLLAQSRPNIIFIWADDMGMAEVNFANEWWGESPTFYQTATPIIDSLARNGAFFSKFLVRPVCTPSRMAMMTGRHPFRLPGNADYGVSWFNTQPAFGIPDTVKTLPEYLRENGYTTAHFGKWHMGCAIPSHLPNSVGFDYSYGTTFGFDDQRTFEFQGIHNFTIDALKYTPPANSFESTLTSAAAIEWIEKQYQDDSSPFFVYYSLTNPHTGGADTIPTIDSLLALAPAGDLIRRKKWASIKDIDNIIGRIWDAVKASGQESNTIIIFTTDNGADPAGAGLNAPFRFAKGASFYGGIRVPAIWYHAGTVDSMSVTELTCIEDLLPTFVQGVARGPSVTGIDGVNIYPLLSGDTIPNRVWYGPNIPGRLWSVESGPWKLMNNGSESVTQATALAESISLYNIETDPTEQTNVAGANPAVVAELRALVDSLSVQSLRGLNQGNPSAPQPRWWGDPFMFYQTGYRHSSLIQDYKE